jgi:hypothetical protein
MITNHVSAEDDANDYLKYALEEVGSIRIDCFRIELVPQHGRRRSCFMGYGHCERESEAPSPAIPDGRIGEKALKGKILTHQSV